MTRAPTVAVADVDRPTSPGRPNMPLAAPVAIALAWSVIIALHASGHGDALDHDALVGERAQLSAGTLAVYASAWILMIAAMMLPSAVPLLRLFAGTSCQQSRPGFVLGAFLSGYLAVWALFGWLALGLDGVFHSIVEATPWLDEHPRLIVAAVLALAGAFQFSALKDRCLTTCRHPAAYLLTHYRRGIPAAWKLGWSHGLFCLGCCWALMLVAFAAGMNDLRWMAAFTALMAYEKVGLRGKRVARSAGVLLLGLAAMLAFQSTGLL
jgi:predicted metal-binding membrane protein